MTKLDIVKRIQCFIHEEQFSPCASRGPELGIGPSRKTAIQLLNHRFMSGALFKYFGTDNDKLNWFANGQVLLTPPKYFNDPWDFLARSEPHTDAELDVEAKKQGIGIN
jgi:hypothetical protein